MTRRFALPLALAWALLLAPAAPAATSGGTDVRPTSKPAAPAGSKGKVTSAGLALAPANAPARVKAIIAAGNRIATKPYRYGGGHGRWIDSGYDCSGSVSFALRGARLLSSPLASGGFISWGKRGRGTWVTIRANGGHMYMVVAGLRFDTSAHKRGGSRWTAQMRSARGYVGRHPAGL